MGQGVAGPAQRSAEHPRPGRPPGAAADSAVSSPPPLRAAPAARSRAQPGRHHQEERDGRQPPRPARTAARSPSPRRPPPPGPPVRQRARPAAVPGAGSPGRARPAADWEVVTRTPGPASRAGPPAPAARGPSPGSAHRRPEPAAVPADQPRRGDGPPVGWRKLARSEVREVGPGGVSALVSVWFAYQILQGGSERPGGGVDLVIRPENGLCGNPWTGDAPVSLWQLPSRSKSAWFTPDCEPTPGCIQRPGIRPA